MIFLISNHNITDKKSELNSDFFYLQKLNKTVTIQN